MIPWQGLCGQEIATLLPGYSIHTQVAVAQHLQNNLKQFMAYMMVYDPKAPAPTTFSVLNGYRRQQYFGRIKD